MVRLLFVSGDSETLPDDMVLCLAVVTLAINQTWAAVMVNVIPNRGLMKT